MSTDVSIFIEPFLIACNPMEKESMKSGDRVVVIGAGLIGNFVGQAPKIRGVEVLIYDVLQSKLDIVKSMASSIDGSCESL